MGYRRAPCCPECFSQLTHAVPWGAGHRTCTPAHILCVLNVINHSGAIVLGSLSYMCRSTIQNTLCPAALDLRDVFLRLFFVFGVA